MSALPGSRVVTQGSSQSGSRASHEPASSLSAPMSVRGRAQKAWKWLRQRGKLGVFAQRNRRLRLSETVPLGEKRFVSLIEVDNISFLIGSSPQSVTLLAQLPPTSQRQPFRGVFEQEWHREGTA